VADLTIQVDPPYRAGDGDEPPADVAPPSPSVAQRARRVATAPFRWLEAHPVKGALFGGYLVAVYLAMRNSVFYDRERLFPWLFVGVAILVIGSGWRRILELVLYWIPFFLLWVAYDLVRGQADNGRDVATTQPITLEKALFAGYVPNNVLQDRFYVREEVQWWEALTGLTYMSHFFVVYVTAAVLFVRNRERFIRWMTALVLLTVLGLLGYWLYPMAPPWMAADQGLIPDLARPGTRGLRLLHLQFADRLWVHGKDNSQMINPVAAMPSLHAGYSMLFSWFFFKRVRRHWVKALLAVYPLAMAFTLMYGGEHYFIDLLAGWLLAIFAVEVSDRFHDWRERRSQRESAASCSEIPAHAG
jgi:membrane-associated phospholipid phosphatase